MEAQGGNNQFFPQNDPSNFDAEASDSRALQQIVRLPSLFEARLLPENETQNITLSDEIKEFNYVHEPSRLHKQQFLCQKLSQSTNHRPMMESIDFHGPLEKQRHLSSILQETEFRPKQASQQPEIQQEPNEASQSHSLYEDQSQKKHLSKTLSQLNLTHNQEMILGIRVISGLQKNIVSLPFRQPINVKAYGIDDYYDIIKQPMDLKTIKKRIADDHYRSVLQIYSDIDLIIQNSLKYNQLNPDFIRQTKNFQKSFNRIKRICERDFRRVKNAEAKGTLGKLKSSKTSKLIRNSYNLQIASNLQKQQKQKAQEKEDVRDFEILSGYRYAEVATLAKKIRKMTPDQQIDLFKKIGIENTLTIDLKLLDNKQMRTIIREVEKHEKNLSQAVMAEAKKDSSCRTTCPPNTNEVIQN